MELPYDFDLPATAYLLISFSVTQFLVSHFGCTLCWQCHCHQVFGVRRLVVELVRQRHQRMFTGL